MTGGVVSSLGKGLTFSSLAAALEGKGLNIAMMKLDPYLNVDPGTMNPFEHGEVYVTDDGAETDLDLGHYYRFTHCNLSQSSNITSGQIYDSVIRRERKGEYLGKTVQVIPHITDEIKYRISRYAKQYKNLDVLFVEIGGTVGDIESLPFMEAIRQFRLENYENCLNIHLTYVPYIPAAGEVKTKPTQHSVRDLREIGIIPDIILCRCEKSLEESIKDKISLFCSVKKENVIDVPDAIYSIYEIPLYLKEQGIDSLICKLLSLPNHSSDLKKWEKIIENVKTAKKEICIGIVGKYLMHQDAYKSVFEALTHAGIAHGIKIVIKSIESDKINEKTLKQCFNGCHGILVPGGFGERGFEGKVLAAKYCRENNIPYFGICLGMQVMAVEFARHVLNLSEANSTEMNQDTKDPIICLIEEQKHISKKGGTMRLGAYECLLKKDTKAYEAYQSLKVSERHRHRLEFNSQYKDKVEEKGLIIAGVEEETKLCEIIEVKGHPWMLGAQFHPEFKSKPTHPHPLFYRFIEATIKRAK